MGVCYEFVRDNRNFSNMRKNFPFYFFLSESCTTIFDFSFHFSSVLHIFSCLSKIKKKKLFPSHVCQIPNFVSIYFLSEVYCKDNRFFFFCQNLPSFSLFSFSIPEIKRRSDLPSPSPSNSN